MKSAPAFKVKSVLSIILLAALVFSFGKIFWDTKSPKAKKTEGLLVYGRIPEFHLIERSSKRVNLSDLEGKVWIADFIFTRCAGICPLMSNKMKILEDKLGGHPDLRLVSFSVDPEYDTPEVLNRYAERFKADPGRWLFLTGSKASIFRLSQQHFHLGVQDVPEAERGDVDQSVQHSSKFVLVDKRGEIRGYYDSESETALERLAQDAERLLQANNLKL